MPTERPPALHLRHLYLENWRNFTRVEADLRSRVVLVGPVASGKSHLLDALCFLRDLAVPGGGFREAVRKRGGVSHIRCLAARQPSEIALAVRVGAPENGMDFEYELQFTQEAGHRPAICRERVTRAGTDLLLRPDEADQQDPVRLEQTCLEQSAANREFRELADFFASIRYFHLLPQLLREPERSVGKHNDPYGGDLFEQIASVSEAVQRGRLRRILSALRQAAPQLRDLELWRDHRGLPHLRARWGHWRPLGAWQTEDQLSDGTLRLLGMLWVALEGTGPLLIEEPELSLDANMVRSILPMLAGALRRAGRQVVLTTHSKDLVAEDAFDPNEVLLLVPGEEGTAVRCASSYGDITAVLDGTLSEAQEDEAVAEDRQLFLFEGEAEKETADATS